MATVTLALRNARCGTPISVRNTSSIRRLQIGMCSNPLCPRTVQVASVYAWISVPKNNDCDLLRTSGYALNAPTNSQVDGIEVRVRRYASNKNRVQDRGRANGSFSGPDSARELRWRVHVNPNCTTDPVGENQYWIGHQITTPSAPELPRYIRRHHS